MPQKNIYIRDADKDVWEKAEELAGRASFSQLITDLLRDHVEQHKRKQEALSMEMKTIEFEIENKDTGRISKKSFKGRWVIDTDAPLEPSGPQYMAGHAYVAAITAKGQIFLGHFKPRDSDHLEDYTVYNSIQFAEVDGWPSELLAAVADELGEDFVEELDI
jgi:predicted CopG family antitoxin